MPSCLPPRYRFWDLVFALYGTVAFLGDLGFDVWNAVKYYESGEFVFAGLHIGLYVLSSLVLQLLSWGWFQADWKDLAAEANGEGKAADEAKPTSEGKAANGHPGVNGMSSAEGTEGSACSVDAAVCMDEQPTDDITYHPEPSLEDNGDTQPPMGTPSTSKTPMPEDAVKPTFLNHFYTSSIWLQPCCRSILHILQLGYPFRCLHSLEVGLAAYKSPECSLYQEYAYFLTHDISMMRLLETFLENTPQLILVLYVIIQKETIFLYQYFSIAFSFICISWAILDYHQSLRLFLKDKQKLNLLPSVIYFLWNFCLISSRILCITLFTVTFNWRISLHFAAVWLAFFLWAFLQKTTFMKSKFLEPFFRASVAVILYFSWFNVADGRTVYRCIVYHVFITIDSLLLLLSWICLRCPSFMDEYESLIIGTAVCLTGLGLITRLIYYRCLHPNVTRETKVYYDEPDGKVGEGTYRMITPTLKKKSWKQNDRMVYLAQHIY
ncbi:XK-related protein 8 [Lithobates pipiens]